MEGATGAGQAPGRWTRRIVAPLGQPLPPRWITWQPSLSEMAKLFYAEYASELADAYCIQCSLASGATSKNTFF